MKSISRDAPLVLVVALAAIVFVLDTAFPLGTAIWLFYLLPLLMSFATSRPVIPPVVACVLVLATAAGFFLAKDGVSPHIAIVNRSLVSVVMLMLGGVGSILIRSRKTLGQAAWVNRGQVETARVLQGEQSLAEVAENATRIVSELLNARAAVLYHRDGHGLRRLATWGVDPAQVAQTMSQDHLRRALDQDRVLVLTACPDTALAWSSGLMRGSSACSVLVPISDGTNRNGIVEFGLDHAPNEATLQLLDSLRDKIGIALKSAQYREHLRELLEETQKQAEELRSHTEELAASNEELAEQTRALQDSERRLSNQQSELEQQNAALESQTQQLEEQRDALARSRRELMGQSEALARESRYKSEFVANMSHELRTPLNALLIMARLMAENRGGNLSDEQVRWAETIEASGQDLLALINDILDLAKIEAGRLDVVRETVSPALIASRLLRKFEIQAREKGLALQVDQQPDLPELQTDPQRLEQILRNFLSNALKFTERGRVTLGVTATAAEIAFSVRDTGIGIATSEQSAVFDAFRQADGTISRKYGGTGLGLSISRELADLLGGHITLDSAPGRGSTFTLHLPLTSAESASALPLHPSPAPAAPLPQTALTAPLAGLAGVTDDRDRIQPGDPVILIAEDDPAFARLMVEIAHELDFRAVVVGTADGAVWAAHHFAPQAIILDMGLPDHTGLSVLDRLKRDIATRHIPVHVVSATDFTREALSQGATGYLLKPVERQVLSNVIRNLGDRGSRPVRRVLIVEDDPAQLQGLQALLGTDVVQTVGASTAAQAVAACRDSSFDCIVLDMTLPDASGFDVLAQLDAGNDTPFPPVIIYTAREMDADEELRLRRYSKSIIIKGAKSPERLIDEVTLFLHQVVSDLPPRQREMLATSLSRDNLLDGRNILIVEDDIRNVYALTGIFEPHGVRLQVARNGREALEVLGRAADGGGAPVDLVLMDVMMPEMDGLTATREIRKIDRWRSLPIIMLTAKAMADDQQQCLEAGANDYLAKPIEVGKLLSLTRVWMPR
ncbi:response regulator [Paracoccus laeviglucosivorans]|uniref:histidine kinase n=1 Tax=Paracoccus laeviglucosivorans TaxID=1197861 RepID=A0A521EPU1_9RHOB|nr:response regulator [Paracoccus laeviglucosivorans]SMO85922.1 Signal transduction histidine kinase [Paracoccus laeviglucosivorans]